jgi:hypothetical protein
MLTVNRPLGCARPLGKGFCHSSEPLCNVQGIFLARIDQDRGKLFLQTEPRYLLCDSSFDQNAMAFKI